MSAQPLLVLGDSRRRVLLTRLADGARRWRGGWAPGSAEKFEAQCEATPRSGYSGPVAAVSTSCWALDVSGERVAVLLLPHVTFSWCVMEAGGLAPDISASVDPDSLAEKLEQEVATSLFKEICAPANDAPSVRRITPGEIESWSREVRAWTAQLRSTDSARMFTLLLDARRVEALAPARAVVRGALNTRRSAVGDNHITLRALVGEASMSVSELADLAIDDVLVLDQHLSEPVTLIADHTGHAVAAGNLGRAGARRAVKVAGMPAQKN